MKTVGKVMARFLAKVVLTLEPTDLQTKFHKAVREVTSHHLSNLMQIIGIDPVVFKTQTPEGEMNLQIWITSFNNIIHRMIMPNYYLGARKYLFMCEGKARSVDFVREIIELTMDKLNALYEFIILVPPFKSKQARTRLKNKFQKLFTELNIKHFSLREWREPEDLMELFIDCAREIVLEKPTTEYLPVGFNLETTEEIVRKIGFTINERHEVIETLNGIRFRVNLEKNKVLAEIIDPEDGCKVSKELCIVVADRGYASITGLGDLRLISVLLAIKDKSILQLKGSRPQEDIRQQLQDLRKKFKNECKKKKQKKEKE